jgi:hypothetical protein
MFVLDPKEPDCTCEHSSNCNHDCHGRHCDPTEHVCSLEFLPDDGGLTQWGCAECTPGGLMPHLEDCPRPVARPSRVASPISPGPIASA